ncbi:uncharacterized protein LOC124157890 [Ischnura elegans]|uniref:uncharacterized protein LOC124157890 n=1 Tax=Ischnura elegans TaxID=197161 RepID=UPI001ED876A4|nr:uncharacterized protein LOC124157890 [Ischnura elegans]
MSTSRERCRLRRRSTSLSEQPRKSAAAVLLLMTMLADGAWGIHVKLHAPPYVVRGGSVDLRCNHSVDRALLHKVEWLKDGGRKLFQFVRGRNPPFRNFSIPGATLDWSRSNEHQIRLVGLELEASGVYSCEVSMETPIYTKPSNDEVITVIQRQAQDPEVWGRKPSYVVGESLEVNCTSSPSHPPAHITWLVNGRQVSEKSLRWYTGPRSLLHRRKHGHHHHHHHNHYGRGSVGGVGRGGHRSRNQYRVYSEEELHDDMRDGDDLYMGIDARPLALATFSLIPSSTTVQLTYHISEESALEGVTEGDNEVTSNGYEGSTIINGRIAITCLATIPAFLGSSSKAHEYADHRLTSVDVDVIVPAKAPPVKEEPIIEEPVEVLLFSSAAQHPLSFLSAFALYLPILIALSSIILPSLDLNAYVPTQSKRQASMTRLLLASSRNLNHACPCR